MIYIQNNTKDVVMILNQKVGVLIQLQILWKTNRSLFSRFRTKIYLSNSTLDKISSAILQ